MRQKQSRQQYVRRVVPHPVAAGRGLSTLCSFLSVELPSAPAGQLVHGHRWRAGRFSAQSSPSMCLVLRQKQPSAAVLLSAVSGSRCGALQPCGQQGGAWPVGVAAESVRHPDLGQRSAGRAAAGRECSGPRAPCGAAGRRGRERYWAITRSFGCWYSSGVALGDAAGRGRAPC